jgi:hypothetical protein
MVITPIRWFAAIFFAGIVLFLNGAILAQTPPAGDDVKVAIAERFTMLQNLSMDYQLTHVDPWAGPATRPAVMSHSTTAAPTGVTSPSARMQFVFPSADDAKTYLPALPAAPSPLSFYPDHSTTSGKAPDQGMHYAGVNVAIPKGSLSFGPIAPRPDKESDCSFSFLQGNALWRSQLTKQTLGNYAAQMRTLVASETAAYKAGRLEVLSVTADGNSKGSLSGPDQMVLQSWIDIGLGLRADRQTIHWLAPAELLAMDLTFDDQHRPVLSHTGDLGMVYQYTFLPQADDALCKYTVMHPSAGGGKLVMVEEISASDFRQVQGVWLPFTLTLVQHSPNRPAEMDTRQTIVVNSYTLNSPGNVIDQYQINWPAGIFIFDHRSDRTVRTEIGNHNLTDVEFSELAQRQMNR